MRPLVLSLAASLFGAAAADAASPYPVEIERQRGETLIIQHTPVPARIGVRKVYRSKVLHLRKAYRRRIVPAEYSDYREYVLDPAIADDCRSAGYARGQLPNGAPVVLNKDVCEGIWFRCATTGPRASCRASASTARCRRPATVLSRAVGHGKSPWRLNRDQIREIEAIEAAARSSGACGSQSPRGIGDCQACQPARSKLELGACLDRAGTERAWTSAGASVGSADSDDLRSRGGLNARLAGRRYF